MTLSPGIYDGISPEAYHSDTLTPEPSLSRSGIHTLLTETPATFAANNPRLTRWPELLDQDGTAATDLGEVLHATVLGGTNGAKFIVGDPGEFMNKKGEPYSTWSGEAKAWKDEQKAKGYVVINPTLNAKALQIGTHLTSALEEKFGTAWRDRKVEQTIIWQRRLNDGSLIWCRARPDAMLPDGTIVDVKTTALSLSDAELGKRIALDGLDLQAAWYQDGMAEGAGIVSRTQSRVPFILAFVQTVPPYSVRFVDLDVAGWPLNITRMRIDIAAHKFGAALKSGVWEDHPLQAHPEPPAWWLNACEKQVGLDGEIDV